MNDADRAFILLFSQLLELHGTCEDAGSIYRLPSGLPPTDVVRVARHAKREGYSTGVFAAALKDLELVRRTHTIEEIWALLKGHFQE